MINCRTFMKRSTIAAAVSSLLLFGKNSQTVEATESPPTVSETDIYISDVEVANNIVTYRKLQSLHRQSLVSSSDIMEFIRTHPMKFRPMPRVRMGELRTSEQYNRLSERLEALTILGINPA